MAEQYISDIEKGGRFLSPIEINKKNELLNLISERHRSYLKE